MVIKRYLITLLFDIKYKKTYKKVTYLEAFYFDLKFLKIKDGVFKFKKNEISKTMVKNVSKKGESSICLRYIKFIFLYFCRVFYGKKSYELFQKYTFYVEYVSYVSYLFQLSA